MSFLIHITQNKFFNTKLFLHNSITMGALNSNTNRLNGALKEKRLEKCEKSTTSEKSTMVADAIDIEWREKHWFEFIKSQHAKVNWKEICQNPNLTINMINDNIDLPWDWESLSINRNLTLEIISKYPDKPWNWKEISSNECITVEMLLQYPNKPWDWFAICRNPKLTIEMIRNIPKYNRCWSVISNNPAITFDMIVANPDFPWNWDEVSVNPNITMEIINANFDKPWVWGKISCNKNIIPITKKRNDNGFFHESHSPAQKCDLNFLLKRALDWQSDLYMYELCSNSYLTFDYIDTHPEIFRNGDVTHYWNDNVFFDSKWQIISNNTFPVEKQKYVDSQTAKITLISLHDFYNEHTEQVINKTEYTFFDCYITKQIVEFL